MSYGLAQARYAGDATETVSAGRLLTMLYDRLVGDLGAAEDAMRAGDVASVGTRIGRAQEILLELHSTLDTSAWAGGESLAQLYVWMVGELMQARLRNQPQRIADCRELLEPLREAWHTAAGAQARPDGGPAAAAGAAAFGVA
jgi:flagellar protein FliS